MGITHQGNLLQWKETKKHAGHVRRVGSKQFINLYRNVKDRKAEAFKWGDEIEHILLKVDDAEKSARVLPKNEDTLTQLKSICALECRDYYGSNWTAEYGTFQVESTPGRPFDCNFSTFSTVESNMRLRRQQVISILDRSNGEICLTTTHLPRFGCPNSCVLPTGPKCSQLTKSLQYPDAMISQFERYKGIEVNTRERRGECVSINVPVYKDENTNSAVSDRNLLHLIDDGAGVVSTNYIHADCTVAASSCSCLQVTFQAKDVYQAKYLYDQLIPMCPIMLALSASTPTFRGYLSDVDCRWNAVSASLDARNREERGIEPLKDSTFVIPKPKFGTPSFYLLPVNEILNDIVAPYNSEIFRQLMNGGIDEHLARHVAHMFIHDPIILYEEDISQNEEDTGHFENMCSTNWSSVRLKPPASDTKMGWRIEFRPLEIQLTDFENAAYVVFIMLLVRTIDKFKLNFAMPMSKVDQNMEEAQRRDAVRERTFSFKENVESPLSGKNTMCSQMSVDVIMNGGLTSTGAQFPGLIPLIKRYITTEEDADDATVDTVSRYLQLISDRAAGRVDTAARWIRSFIEQHPDYKKDSVISERINYDLMKLISDISDGTIEPRHLNSAQS